MRTVIILARKHGAKQMELLSGPEVPAHEQKAKYKEFCRLDVHPELATVQLWDSNEGFTKERKLLSPKEADAKAKAQAKARAEAEAKQKAKADADKAAAAAPKAKTAEKPKAPKAPHKPHAPKPSENPPPAAAH